METRIAARLRDQLGTAKNANEMFRIFSRFNALFVRGHIRGAIREYQAQLIQRVKDDIEALHNKFKVRVIKKYVHVRMFCLRAILLEHYLKCVAELGHCDYVCVNIVFASTILCMLCSICMLYSIIVL